MLHRNDFDADISDNTVARIHQPTRIKIRFSEAKAAEVNVLTPRADAR